MMEKVKMDAAPGSGATVPLYYEKRIPELQLLNENLNDEMIDNYNAGLLSDDEFFHQLLDFARSLNGKNSAPLANN